MRREVSHKKNLKINGRNLAIHIYADVNFIFHYLQIEIDRIPKQLNISGHRHTYMFIHQCTLTVFQHLHFTVPTCQPFMEKLLFVLLSGKAQGYILEHSIYTWKTLFVSCICDWTAFFYHALLEKRKDCKLESSTVFCICFLPSAM